MFKRLVRQLRGVSPFTGDATPTRVKLISLWSKRPTLPFPHPWNYDRPIEILETYFWDADNESGAGRHNRYLDVFGASPVLVTRDPGMIRAILTATGDREGQFDRDTLPSTGIARATGKETLLFANGRIWRKQRKASASPFGKMALFQPEVFDEFGEAFRVTVRQRLTALQEHLEASQSSRLQIEIEPEIKAIMLELLVNCFFGAELSYEQFRNKYVPALERIIDHIVSDTVINQLGIPLSFRAKFSSRLRQIEKEFEAFDELTDEVLAVRKSDGGNWRLFKSDASDDDLRSNIKVFLAGALEATTSYATWAISHLARDQDAQDRVFEEVKDMESYSPENLANAKFLGDVLKETLRLTPSLYFLPRRATTEITVTAADGRTMGIPRGTHLLLDVWHANRHEDHWGESVTGFRADEFAPQRWEQLSGSRASKEALHFGFGHGARVCPGKHLAQLEVGLTVGAFVKLFKFEAVHSENPVNAGVSTKPADGTLIELELRRPIDW